MTEQEAKTKWCQMRQIIRIGDVRIDNTDGKEFTLNCIGPACMMWRVSEGNDGTRWHAGGGYCGLAGKP